LARLLEFTLNGRDRADAVADNILLLDFLREITRRTGCGLLLDVNNVEVCAANHGFDPFEYLDAFPLSQVGEIHLAGYAEATDEAGHPLLIDVHDSPVRLGVWELYDEVAARIGPMPTLIEWDNDVPDWRTLHGEASRAERHAANAAATTRAKAFRHAV